MLKMLVDVLVRFAPPVLLIVIGRVLVLVNSQLTPALLMYMTYSNRLASSCADGLLLLHIYIYIYIYSVDYLYAPAVVNCVIIYVLTVCA